VAGALVVLRASVTIEALVALGILSLYVPTRATSLDHKIIFQNFSHNEKNFAVHIFYIVAIFQLLLKVVPNLS
jgi:hypothetical protein